MKAFPIMLKGPALDNYPLNIQHQRHYYEFRLGPLFNQGEVHKVGQKSG